MSQNTRQAAKDYRGRNFAVVPVPSKQKGPVVTDWPNLRIHEKDLEDYFSMNSNIGLILGDPSGGLVDIDCDVPEASVVAEKLLPPTEMIHGRVGNPKSHFYFRCEPVPPSKKFCGPDKSTLIEIRGNGHQTIVPPSVHSTGESITWYRAGAPGVVDGATLTNCVEQIAAATVLARSWPDQGQRHDAANATAGMLLRAGWTEEKAAIFVEAVACAARDEESDLRVRNVRSTAARHKAGGTVTGAPTLSQIVGDAVVRQVMNWLSLREEEAISPAPPVCIDTPWPDEMAEEAFHGVAGDIVRAIEPHTEADRSAVLLQFLAGAGNAMGRNAYFLVEGDKHYCNLFVLIVGSTSKARKGTSWSRALEVFRELDPEWTSKRILSGLSSGEGLIWAVRDPVLSRGKNGDEELVDEGVEDKRLLVIEPEFASVLRILDRDGNTLSAVIREAWDRGDLAILTKNSPARASEAHVSIIGHITREELLRTLNATERANGFANRFLIACAKRSKLLPEGGDFQSEKIADLTSRARNAIEFARSCQKVERTPAARKLWAEIYVELSADTPGVLGAITSRAEAQVLRLSLLYALLDSQRVIDEVHIRAALAVWNYAKASVRYIFDELLGDPTADHIFHALREKPGGLTRTEISGLFKRHKPEHEIERALGILFKHGLAASAVERTGGRSAARWKALEVAKKAR